jgi:hypothetical protein
MIDVEEIKLLLLLGNRLKHIRGNVRYLVTWDIKEFTVGYSTLHTQQDANTQD